MSSFQSAGFASDVPPWLLQLASTPNPSSSAAVAPESAMTDAPLRNYSDDQQRPYAVEDAAPRTPPSPERPPVSPITPVVPHATLARLDSNGQHILPPPINTDIPPLGASSSLPRTQYFTETPAPVPIAESEEPDVIALRAAISILQMQRDRAARDIRVLEQIKGKAHDDPEGFVREYAGRRKGGLVQRRVVDYLGPTIAKDERDLEDLALPSEEEPDDDEDSDSAIASEEDNGGRSPLEKSSPTTTTTPAKSSSSPLLLLRPSSAPPSDAAAQKKPFPIMPDPQNIVRAPAINWSKYHVVGASLDKIHYDQLRRPSLGDGVLDPRFPDRPPEFRVAAPWSEDRDRERSDSGGPGLESAFQLAGVRQGSAASVTGSVSANFGLTGTGGHVKRGSEGGADGLGR